jgi:hypothetical protein
MVVPRYSVTESVHLELRHAGRLIVRRYARGTYAVTTDDDRLALEHLVATGHARRARTRRARPKEV